MSAGSAPRARAVDVAVVGGGLVGTAAADELVRLGATTALIDDHDPGRATDAGAGILSPGTSQRTDDAWYALAGLAGEHLGRLAEDLARAGAPDTGYARCGALMVSDRPGDEEWFDAAATLVLSRSGGATGPVRELTPDEAQDRFPPLRAVRRALFDPRAARVDGRMLLGALRWRAEAAGLQVVDAHAVSVRTSGGEVVGVDLADGTLVECGAVIIACGAWSPPLLGPLGSPVAVTPMKGQIVHLVLPGASSESWPIVQPVLSHYLVSWPGGRVACGGTMEPRAGFDTRVTAAGMLELLRECLHTAPGLAGASLYDVRVGLRPNSADDLPVVGPLGGWPNAYVATGHSTEGLLLGPYTAAMVANAARGQALPPEMAMLDPQRSGLGG